MSALVTVSVVGIASCVWKPPERVCRPQPLRSHLDPGAELCEEPPPPGTAALAAALPVLQELTYIRP